MKNYLILVIFLSLFFSPSLAKSPPPGTGTADVPANIMIMLDNSGSMAWGLLDRPVDVSVDTSGNIYVLEYVKGQISVFNSSGVLQRICGNNTQGYKFSFPRQLTVHNNKVFIADTANARIVSINKDTCALIGITAFNMSGAQPMSIAVRGNDIIYTNLNDGLILIFTHKAPYYTVDRNNYRSEIQNIIWPNVSEYITAMHITGDRLLFSTPYVAGVTVSFKMIDTVTNRIDPAGANKYPPAGFGNIDARRSTDGLMGPTALRDAVFDSNYNAYISDSHNYRVQKFAATFNSSGTYSAKVGTFSHINPFYIPYGMGVDSSDNIYVADFGANKIYKFNSSLVLTGTITGGGSTTVGGSGSFVNSKNRMDVAKNVIKKIVSNTELTTGANFGLMEWGFPNALSDGGLRIRVPVDSNGAKKIYDDPSVGVDRIIPNGSTFLNAALNLAKTYFNNGSNQSIGNIFHPSPINRNASCQLNYLIVISDGEWEVPLEVNTIANSLNTQTPSIKTFVVGFAIGGSSTNYANLALAGGTKLPLYADDEETLLQNLTAAISQILSSRLTFSTPAISSTSDSEFIYQATFIYSSNKQWEGNLKKYKFENSSLGAEVWDAADILNRRLSSRNIWTTGLSVTSINNFVDTYSSELQAKFLSPSITSTTAAAKLINFIRGVDTYDQDNDKNTTESRHKLSDIYRSKPIIVGPPTEVNETDVNNNYDDVFYKLNNGYNYFVNSTKCGTTCKIRREILLVGSNGGMLHAFDTTTGEELWGFIPPSLLNKLPKIISNTPNYTNAIYGVDGTAVVKDIYYGGSWKTIALVGLGRGGQSYFALDISNPTAPTHLFTIENDDFRQVVNFWDSSGTKTSYLYTFGSVSPSTKDYSKLGESWSTPRIFRINVNGTQKWVAAFGAGYNGSVNPNLGSAVFIMDLENEGNVLSKIDISDLSNGIANSVPSDLVVVTANGTSRASYFGAMIYALDLEGKITKIDITSTGTTSSFPSYKSIRLFDVQTTTTNGRYIFTGGESSIDKSGNFWLYFGTGDILKIQDQTSGISNKLYGIKDKDFPLMNLSATPGTIANCKNNTVSSAQNCPGSNDFGWYIDLPSNQKVSAQPTIKNQTVYYPIYEPSTGLNICSAGQALIKATSTTCGETITFQGNAYLNLGGGVATKVQTIGTKIVVGISGKKIETSAKESIVITDQVGAVESSVTVEAWREN